MPESVEHLRAAIAAAESAATERHRANTARLDACEAQVIELRAHNADLTGRVATLERESHEAAAVRRALEARGVDEVSVVRELRVLRDGSTRLDGARMAGVVVAAVASSVGSVLGILKVVGLI